MSTYIEIPTPTSSTAEALQTLESRLSPLRARLTAHPLYASIRTPQHIRIFMQSHVFAVWDFMSLLKALQSQLTCVRVPWVPSPFPASRRFINEIVLGEESDEFQGKPISHFELYLQAMQEAGADTLPIRSLLEGLATIPPELVREAPLSSVLSSVNAPLPARAFVEATFRIIHSGSLPAIAAAFTFGREDVIPDIFRNLVRDLNAQHSNQLNTILWYLERHIEVDSEDHGPLSLRMVADLCGTNPDLREQAALAAETAIHARLSLWDGILTEIQSNPNP